VSAQKNLAILETFFPNDSDIPSLKQEIIIKQTLIDASKKAGGKQLNPARNDISKKAREKQLDPAQNDISNKAREK